MLTAKFLKPSTDADREMRYRSKLLNRHAAARAVASTPAAPESIPPEDSAMSGKKRSPRSKSAKKSDEVDTSQEADGQER